MVSQLISQCVDVTFNKLTRFKISFCVPCSQGESVCFPFLPRNNNNISLWPLVFVLACAFYCWLFLWFRFCSDKWTKFLDHIHGALPFAYNAQNDLNNTGNITGSVLFNWSELCKRKAAGVAQKFFLSSDGRTAMSWAREGAREIQRNRSDHRSVGSGCSPSWVIASCLPKAPCSSNQIWYSASFLF